jgi:hypothetical protein
MNDTQLLDVQVESTREPLGLEDPLVDRPLPGGRAHLKAVRDRAVLRVDGVGAFAIEHGARVRFAREPGASRGAGAPFLRTTVAGLLLAQRGRFALHASVAEVAGASIAVCGPRGAGKSTTVLRLEQRGHALVTDDLTALRICDDVIVEPLSGHVRVFSETAEQLGVDTSAAECGPFKLLLPVARQHSRPLRAVVVLGGGGEGAVGVRRLHGAEAGWALATNTYRGALFRAIWETEMFAWAGAVAARVPVHSVTRPARGWTVDAVADAVEEIAEGVA